MNRLTIATALALLTTTTAWAQLSQTQTRVIPGTAWVFSVTLDRNNEFSDCRVTKNTNGAELGVTLAPSGTPTFLLQDQYQAAIIKDTLGWREDQTYGAVLFFTDAKQRTKRYQAMAHQLGPQGLLIMLYGVDRNVVFNSRGVTITVGAISARGYNIEGLHAARDELYACERHYRGGAR